MDFKASSSFGIGVAIFRHFNVFHLYLQDICRCSVFYADEMSEKVEGMGESQNVYETKFEVTNEVGDIYYFML
jgi:hypothetical protein